MGSIFVPDSAVNWNLDRVAAARPPAVDYELPASEDLQDTIIFAEHRPDERYDRLPGQDSAQHLLADGWPWEWRTHSAGQTTGPPINEPFLDLEPPVYVHDETEIRDKDEDAQDWTPAALAALQVPEIAWDTHSESQ